jgi:type IX secretion system substrate protein
MMKAKIHFIVTIASWLCYDLIGQSFEIPIYFEDSAGYKDTIVLGYDPLASYDIDTSFGEFDIIDSTYADNMEVRAAIYDYNIWPELPRILESKKMIVGNVCSYPSYTGEGNAIMVVIKSQNWPITMRWDNTLFLEECNFIDIIDCTPGGWFDVCGAGHPHSLFEMRLTDTVSYYDTEFKIEADQDTLSALFFRFYSDFGSGFKDVPESKIDFFPNPTQGLITFDLPLNIEDMISVRNIMGRPVSFDYNNQQVDLLQAPDGMYILTVKLHTGESVALKVIKTGS